MKNNKVVLAYSGGLDTSYCIPFLSREKELEVHAVTINTGGFGSDELRDMESRAMQLGAKSFMAIDGLQSYYDKCIRFLIYGNVLRYQTYPLSVSAERVIQAVEIARYAQRVGARYLAHGSTGAGNDQIRFDLIWAIMAPDLEILTPIRDQQLSRQAEVAYLQGLGFDWKWEKAKYSINKGLWGTSVGGAETLTSHQSLPETAYPSQLQKEGSEECTLIFESGELVGVNDRMFDQALDAIRHLQELAAPFAIGRDTHVGDTIIGIKGRVGFEAAAPLVIIKAHHLLEKHILSKWQMYWKQQLSEWYGMMLHEGQYLDPVMRNIEQFLADTQSNVSGKVFVRFYPYRFELQGIASPFDQMRSEMGTYGEMNKGWTGEDAKGFTKIISQATKIYYSLNKLDL
ncbi:MAG: argininosuccinate synthase [Saprospiraceae bacterium]|nr:argininosuccinate synthase [Saprospiraceae bacterium]